MVPEIEFDRRTRRLREDVPIAFVVLATIFALSMGLGLGLGVGSTATSSAQTDAGTE